MPKDNEKQRLFTRRALILGGVQVTGFALLSGRLAYLQLMKDDKYSSLSENNRIKLQLVAPERGNILDWRGEAFATNEKNYQLYMDMSGFKRDIFKQVTSKIHALIGLPDKTREKLETIRLRSAMRPEMLKENLSWEDVSKIELYAADLPGVFINLGQVRHYILGE